MRIFGIWISGLLASALFGGLLGSLISHDYGDLYPPAGDRAYDSDALRARLTSRGVSDRRRASLSAFARDVSLADSAKARRHPITAKSRVLRVALNRWSACSVMAGINTGKRALFLCESIDKPGRSAQILRQAKRRGM